MKNNDQKKVAGVWLDHKNAIIIAHPDAPETGDFRILKKVKGPQVHFRESEHTLHNAESAELTKYYKSVSSLLSNYDEIFIFGPGIAQEQFRNYLKEDKHFQEKKVTIDSADHLTDPQMIAKVRDFYKTQLV